MIGCDSSGSRFYPYSTTHPISNEFMEVWSLDGEFEQGLVLATGDVSGDGWLEVAVADGDRLSICSRSPRLHDSTSFIVTHVPISTVISADGGELIYHYMGHTTSLAVPPGALSAPSVFTISYHIPPTTTGQLRGMDHFFDLDSTQTVFTTPLTLTISYSESVRGPIVPGTENLYRWQDSQWVTDSITLASRCSDGLSAQITHLSLFGVLGESKRVYLPLVLK
jgi:hypothetical protein